MTDYEHLMLPRAFPDKNHDIDFTGEAEAQCKKL